jgi:Tol biopolymer transport system component
LLEPEVPATPVLVPRRRQPVVLALAVLAIAASAAALYFSRRTAPAPPATHLVIPLPAGQEITGAPAISPDGRTVAYVAKSQAGEAQLYLRDLGSFAVRLVEQSAGALYPFFSPDGVWVAFEARGQIFKAAITGGAPVKMADAPEPDGADWVEDGTLVFPLSFSSGLARIPASGGKAEAITKPDGGKFGLNHGLPQALPGGKFILFTVHGKEVNGTALLSLETRQWQLVLPNQTGGVYASSGQIFASNTNAEVRAAAFDPQHPTPVNADNLVLSDVSYQAYDLRPYLAVSKNGTLVYAPGNPSKKTLVWVDRQGAVQPASPQQADYIFLHLSPDGTRAVVDEDTGLWIHDLQRGSRSRMVQGSSHPVSPIWSPDGKRIDFSYDLEGDFDIYWQPADGSRAPERLLKRPYNQYPESIAPDGTLAFAESDPVTGEDLLLLAPDGRVTPWQVRQAYDSNAQFSPDGRWLAYDSDESGRREVYVEAFPSRNKKALVSSGGGIIPIWSHDGKELFYCSPDSIMAVSVGGDGAFGQPRRLFDRSEYYFDFQTYDVSPDAKRFLMIRPDPGSVPRQLNVILNWFDELRKR